MLSLFFILQACKGYKDPISLEAAQRDRLDYVKVTLNNGDERVFELIEYRDGSYYGVTKEDGEQVRIELDQNEVQEVKQKDKKSSSFVRIMGVLVGIGGVALLVLMFA
jgi:hypothetical protein